MTSPRFLLQIDGEEAADLYPDVVQVEVELDEEEAAVFRVELSITMASDGAWSHVDDERLAPWRRAGIQVGFDDGFESLVSGLLTRVDTTFQADEGRCRIELWGSDESALLDRTERLRAWPDKTDSDIAGEIFAEYALGSTVDVTAPVHGAKVSTIVQRETDLQFLRRLARRNGFECFIEDGKGFFRAPPPPTNPQPLLAAHFGGETTVTAFAVRLDARTPTDVGMFQLDRTEKTVLTTTVSDTRQRALGAVRAADLRPAGLDPAAAFVAMSASTGPAEMTPLCQSLYDRNDWFVTGEGVVDGAGYGAVLRPRRPVTIKGVGERHSGLYLVSHVTHTLDAGGYVQRFRVKRNAVGVTGAEDFGDAGPGLLGALGALA